MEPPSCTEDCPNKIYHHHSILGSVKPETYNLIMSTFQLHAPLAQLDV